MTRPISYDVTSFMETNDPLFESMSLETKLWGFLYSMRNHQSQLDILRSMLNSMQGRLDPGSGVERRLDDVIDKLTKHLTWHGCTLQQGGSEHPDPATPATKKHAKTLVLGVLESRLEANDLAPLRYLMCQYGTGLLEVVAYSWELPGGYLAERGERFSPDFDPLNALMSYVRNQTGLVITSSEYVTSYARASDDANVMMFKLAGENGPPRAGLPGSCVIDHAWMTWQQMHDLRLQGVAPWICDAMGKYITERNPN